MSLDAGKIFAFPHMSLYQGRPWDMVLANDIQAEVCWGSRKTFIFPDKKDNDVAGTIPTSSSF